MMEEIVHGESKNVEFKVMLPKDSEKYTKTIVAFANTQGGQLIIGVDDESREVVGVDNDSVFKVMDSIANAVSDSCTPQIVPDIAFRTLNGKTVVVVTVTPGANRPYYLKSKGKEKGTYVRVAGTSRLADPGKIRELEYEGERISWDELTCVGYHVTENAIKKLCRDINRYRKEMQEQREGAQKMAQVTRAQLVNWNVIKKTEDGYLASNAFALLTGKHFPYSKTQCAVFAGTERGEFIDKQEYAGPLYTQIEEAYAFVLRNIRRSAKVEGLVRREKHELPPAAIREMIINAHCHRNFFDPSCIQVALYDNRLEVTSPGGLCYGLTLSDALSGYSKQRNRVVAEVFSQMGLIEAWGTGLQKICRLVKEDNLSEPEFIETSGYFRTNLYRNTVPLQGCYSIGDGSEEHCNSIGESSVKFGERMGKGSVEFGERMMNAPMEFGEKLVNGSVKSSGSSVKDLVKFGENPVKDLVKFGENPVKDSVEFGKGSVKDSVKSGESSVKNLVNCIGSSVKDSAKFGENSVKGSVNNDENLVKDSVKFDKSMINETKRKILMLIGKDNQISAAAMAGMLSISLRATEKNIRELREAGILVRHGAARGGYWEIAVKK